MSRSFGFILALLTGATEARKALNTVALAASTGLGRLACVFCGARQGSWEDLRRHLLEDRVCRAQLAIAGEEEEGRLEKSRCDGCEGVFYRSELLKRHRKSRFGCELIKESPLAGDYQVAKIKRAKSTLCGPSTGSGAKDQTEPPNSARLTEKIGESESAKQRNDRQIIEVDLESEESNSEFRKYQIKDPLAPADESTFATEEEGDDLPDVIPELELLGSGEDEHCAAGQAQVSSKLLDLLD